MKWLICLLATFALWMLLFCSAELAVVGAGVFFALLVSTLFGDIYPDNLEKVLNPTRWLYFFIYLPYFLWQVIRANVDVMLRVIPPKLPIRPGIVKVHTQLKSNLGRTFLANSITLTPGTLTVDIVGGDLYVHWINISTDDPQEQTRRIVQRFEGLLKRIFE